MFSAATRHSTTMPSSSSSSTASTSSPHSAPAPPPPRSGAAPPPSIRSRATRLLGATTSTSSTSTTVPTPPSSAPKPRKPQPARLTEAEKLARDNARMEERLNALRLQLDMHKTKYKSLRRVASAGTAAAAAGGEGEGGGSIWKSGAAAGGLTSHAREVLEGQKRFLKLRALDKIEYIGTVPASVLSPSTAPSTKVVVAPRASSTSSSRPQSASSSSGRKTWGSSAASSPKPGQALSHAAQPATASTWTVPDTLSHLQDSNTDGTESMSAQDSGFFTPMHSRPSSSSRYSLNSTELPTAPELHTKRMTSLQSVYQFDQRLSSAPEQAASAAHPPLPPSASASWWDGHVDEQANQSAFQDAVREWRAGGCKQADAPDTGAAATPTGRGGGGGDGGWWDGEYDEQANQAAFASAVKEWRGGEHGDMRQRPATTATCSVGTVGGEEVSARGQGQVTVEFSEGMSLMEKMLLRRWKREMIHDNRQDEASPRVREVTVEEAFQSPEYELD